MSEERNSAEWVKESVIEKARETGDVCASGEYLAYPREGTNKIDVYTFSEVVEE